MVPLSLCFVVADCSILLDEDLWAMEIWTCWKETGMRPLCHGCKLYFACLRIAVMLLAGCLADCLTHGTQVSV
jgi:hypothetical protein